MPMRSPSASSPVDHLPVANRFSRWQRFLQADYAGIPAPVLFIIAYFVLQAVLMTLIRNGASFDGAEQLITSQSLEWGYGRSQPPLYTWLLVALDTVIPAPLAAEHGLKAMLFIAGYLAIFATAQRIGLSRPASALAMFATFLLPEIGWQAQTAYTHSTLVFATGALLLYVYAGLTPRSSLWQHALFGTLAGVALLSKFSAGFLILAMIVGLIFCGQVRAIFGRKQALAGLACFVLVTAPHAIWSLNHLDLLFALSNRFEIHAYANPIVARVIGLLTYLSSVAIFIAPLAVIAVVTAGWPWRFTRPMTEGERRLHAMFVAGLIIMALTPILSGASDFAPRWPLAAVFPFGLLAASFVERTQPGKVAAVALIGAGVGVAMLLAMNVRAALPGSRSENDYTALLAAIEQRAGPVRSVAFLDYPILANLRIARPELRLVMPAFPFTQRYLDGETIFLWTGDDGFPPELQAQVRAAGRDPDRLVTVEIPVMDSYGNTTSTVVRAAF